MSTFLDAPELRVRTLPFRALAGLDAPLADALAQVLGGAAAERVLDRLLRAHRDLDAQQRQALAEAVFGVGLWRRRLAYHTGVEVPSPQHSRLLLFALLRDLAQLPERDAADLSGLTPPLPPPRAPPEDLARRYSFPDWIARTIERELGPAAEAFARAANLPGPVTLRTNTLVCSRDELQRRLAEEGIRTEPGTWSPLALHITTPRPNIFGLEAWRAGAFEVQDEGSQLIAPLTGAKPDDTVLDYCAGAGGKTLQLAAMVGESGAVHAHDVDPERLDRLRTRAGRAHAAHIIRVWDEEKRCLSPIFHAVLVDAPCSELGVLRRGPDLRFRIDPAEVERLPARQRDILQRASRHVLAGGRLVYATCTIRREENEEVAAEFERSNPQFIRVRVQFPFETPGSTDTFFAAVWSRDRW